ncbi:hypothetical protein ABZ897_08355 [Nonomuraea sp. NPDC046802]|uniref:hypothetical protein n=1 Tax=Nonomuraea sp. NPDC046802 TaxID=3154919 RepID=UPI0033D1FED6
MQHLPDSDPVDEDGFHRGRVQAVRDYGGDFDWGGVFVIEDLDGYWEYLTHPAHAHTDRIGMPLVEKYDSSDITDDDPQLGAKIADLHRRRYESDPELAALVGMLP